MRKIIKDKEVQKNIITLSISGILIFLGISFVKNFDLVTNFIYKLIGVLAPFVWGIIFSFFLCHFASSLEKRMPENWSFKRKRSISTSVSIICLILLIVAILGLIIPQVVTSISSITKTAMSFLNNAPDWLVEIEDKLNIPSDLMGDFNEMAKKFVSTVFSLATTSIPNLINTTISTVSSLFNFVIGFIVCIYVLNDREHLLEISRNTFRAAFSKSAYIEMTKLFNLLINKIYRFFEGKIIDSLIIGIITFLFMIISGLEYQLLIAVIIGITNIIPFFGPFIGAVPCILILLIVNPLHALIFLAFVIILQQVDGNIIGPKILGDSVGLSSIWIMFAILIGGAYFGFVGMIMGVPVFSALYITIKKWVSKRLDEKGIENPYHNHLEDRG